MTWMLRLASGCGARTLNFKRRIARMEVWQDQNNTLYLFDMEQKSCLNAARDVR